MLDVDLSPILHIPYFAFHIYDDSLIVCLQLNQKSTLAKWYDNEMTPSNEFWLSFDKDIHERWIYSKRI